MPAPNPILNLYYKYGAKKILDDLSERVKQNRSDANLENSIVGLIKRLSKDGNIDTTSSNGDCILHLFPYSSRVLTAFIEAGGNINLKNDDAKTPLVMFFATKRGNSDSRIVQQNLYTQQGRDEFYRMFKLYLESGADPNDCPIATDLGFHLADPLYKHKDKNYVSKMLDLASDYHMNFNLSDYDYPPIVELISNDKVELACEFIKRGANPNYVFKNSMHDLYTSVLHEAVRCYNPNTVETLLQAGADPNLRLPHTDQTACFYLYCSHDNGTCISQKEKIAELLSQYGADFNLKDKEGKTVLTRNLLSNSYIPVKKIVELGAKPFADNNGDTPLHLLVRRFPPAGVSLEEDVNALIEAGNEVNAVNKYGKTPLAIACRFYKSFHKMPVFRQNKDNYERMFFALIKKGADIDVLDDNEEPAIKLLPKKLQNKIREIVEYQNAVNNIQETDMDYYER